MRNHRGLFKIIVSRARHDFVVAGFCLTLLAASPLTTEAAALLISPTSGTFTVGSTFDVQILLDTEGKSVNALDIDFRFPPDRLQLVSPQTNVSVISLWTSQPQFNNQTGRVHLQGGIPRGINVASALVATLTFRVKSVGTAILHFSDTSKVLLNDGLGTNDFSRQENAVYSLVLPPPAGPIVVSETHPNQTQWYSNPNLLLTWATNEAVQNYSFVFDEEPVSIPDDRADGNRGSMVYKSVPDGKHYFHIKAFREGSWGGITHFGVNIDTEPPAGFPLEILPGKRTNVRNPVVKFSTTDTLSGIDHYELKLVSLQPLVSDRGDVGNRSLFIEAESPYILSTLDVGAYDLFIRVYDKAGNYQEIVNRLVITSRFFGFSSAEGLIIGSLAVSWLWLIGILIFVIVLLWDVAYQIRKKHLALDKAREAKELPEKINQQIEELRRYKEKYGSHKPQNKSTLPGTLLLILLLGGALFNVLEIPKVYAQMNSDEGVVELAPPYVTTLSKDVSNSEIFYVGGKTDIKDVTVTIFTQNLLSGETTSYNVVSDKRGEWFYRHNGFLSPGKYLLWTQATLGNLMSPPSPQMEIEVARTAIVFGVSRLSYEMLYFVIALFLLSVIICLICYMLYHAYHHRRKHRLLLSEIREAEESIKRGFAVLRRDIEQELAVLKNGRQSRRLTPEEERREEELYRDLKDTEQRIGKEVWDIEETENNQE